MTQKIKTFILMTFVSMLFLGLFIPASISAARQPSKKAADCASGKVMDNPNFKPNNEEPEKICVPLGSNTDCNNETGLCNKNPIVRNLNNIVRVLSALVGVVVVGNIILGGIQFAIAGDKADAVSAAKQRVVNGLIALVAFLFIFAFLQWLIPGGIL